MVTLVGVDSVFHVHVDSAAETCGTADVYGRMWRMCEKKLNRRVR